MEPRAPGPTSPNDVPASAAAALNLDALTDAERRVLAHALRGLTVPEIAERLNLAEPTAREHLARLYGKLGLAGRTDLASRVAAEAGRDDPPPERTEDDPDPRPPSELPFVIVLVFGLAVVVLLTVLLPYAAIVTGPGLIYVGWRLRQSRRSSALAFAALWILLVGGVLSVLALAILVLLLLALAGVGVAASDGGATRLPL